MNMLAEVLERDATELRRELEDRGTEMPIDSLHAVEVIVRLEEQYGVELDDREAGAAMRSVTALARHILEVQAR